MTDALLKLLARLREDKEQEIQRRPGVVFALVPASGALLQDFVIAFLVVFDDAFEADIAPRLDAAMIARQQEQQPGDAAIAVAEWMDSKEVEG